MRNIFVLLMTIIVLSASPSKQQCPRGWDRTVNITEGNGNVTFTPAKGYTITHICVNGEKRHLRDSAVDLPVTFQLSELTGYNMIDAAAKLR